jgi:hypothetical protein
MQQSVIQHKLQFIFLSLQLGELFNTKTFQFVTSGKFLYDVELRSNFKLVHVETRILLQILSTRNLA